MYKIFILFCLTVATIAAVEVCVDVEGVPYCRIEEKEPPGDETARGYDRCLGKATDWETSKCLSDLRAIGKITAEEFKAGQFVAIRKNPQPNVLYGMGVEFGFENAVVFFEQDVYDFKRKATIPLTHGRNVDILSLESPTAKPVLVFSDEMGHVSPLPEGWGIEYSGLGSDTEKLLFRWEGTAIGCQYLLDDPVMHRFKAWKNTALVMPKGYFCPEAMKDKYQIHSTGATKREIKTGGRTNAVYTVNDDPDF